MPASVDGLVPAGGAAAPAARGPGRLQQLVRLAARDPFALAALLIFVGFAAVALLAPWLAPFDPMEILFQKNGRIAANLPAGAEHWLGTTKGGRDILSQLIWGSRSALLVGLAAAFGVVVVGTLAGTVSGYAGGLVDAALMRLADLALAIPFLPFVIVLAIFGASLGNVVAAVTLLLWPNTARVIRAQVLSIRTRTYIEAARATGSPAWRILTWHVVPAILPLSLLYGSIAIGWAILAEASVSFLGFGGGGISWGYMLQDAFASQALSRGQYLWFVPPGLCIILVVVAGFFLSRGTEEILIPKLRD